MNREQRLENCIERMKKFDTFHMFERKYKEWEQYDLSSRLYFAEYCELGAGTNGMYNLVSMRPWTVSHGAVENLKALRNVQSIKNIRKCEGDPVLIQAMLKATEALDKKELIKLSGFVAEHQDHLFYLCPTIKKLAKNVKPMQRLLQYFDDHGVEHIQEISEMSYFTSTDYKQLQLFDIVDKYFDKFDFIFSILKKINVDKTGIDELKSDRAYNAISKNPNSINRILSKSYGIISDNIEDWELSTRISYDDLDYLDRTHKMVREIHSERKDENLYIIENGFYEEMNRAISQGRNFNEKLNMLRVYCTEVQRSMADNAEELMVVVDET